MPFDQRDFQIEAKPEVKSEPWRRVLLDAAERVRRGWCQNAYSDGQGGVCAYGAINEAATGQPNIMDATGADLALFRLVGDVLAFNDAPGRTAEEVAQALEAAARTP